MAKTYEPIATTTLGSNQTTVTFSSIASTYTDIRIICSLTSSAAKRTFMRFNGDSGSNYGSIYMSGDGSTTSSGDDPLSSEGNIDYASNTDYHTICVDLMNYKNTTTYKTWLSRSGNGTGIVFGYVGVWNSTAAINQISINSTGASGLLTGSTFTLYGIKAA
jgi:hypothetical protein